MIFWTIIITIAIYLTYTLFIKPYKRYLPCGSNKEISIMLTTDPPGWQVVRRLTELHSLIQLRVVQRLCPDFVQHVDPSQASACSFFSDGVNINIIWGKR